MRIWYVISNHHFPSQWSCSSQHTADSAHHFVHVKLGCFAKMVFLCRHIWPLICLHKKWINRVIKVSLQTTLQTKNGAFICENLKTKMTPHLHFILRYKLTGCKQVVAELISGAFKYLHCCIKSIIRMAPNCFASLFVSIFLESFCLNCSVAPCPQGDVFLVNTHSQSLGVCIDCHLICAHTFVSALQIKQKV